MVQYLDNASLTSRVVVVVASMLLALGLQECAEEADEFMKHTETAIGEEKAKVLRKTKRRTAAGQDYDGPPEVDESA
eukprot:CAMPEP_0184546664 /NCGR_PEP_ID=MMETSP0199_2-20130426/5088_1 /TAXON_ID=1112570 /ORGANISM="Thraustochytrium sp., Strain LLF1b" /LENGTH=76 /DNA_ID=CAMNT_0026941087 /DNA_START=1044 /DNA_END=1274 /DNA_ORIENTATION=+